MSQEINTQRILDILTHDADVCKMAILGNNTKNIIKTSEERRNAGNVVKASLPYYYEMRYQIPPFFIALTPDINGHCDIDDSYYAYYEATLDDYYSCLTMPPPIIKEQVKFNVMSSVKNLLLFVNKLLQRLRVGNGCGIRSKVEDIHAYSSERHRSSEEYEDNHLTTYIRTEANIICSGKNTVRAEGYMMRIAVSFPCPINKDKLDENNA